MPPTFFQWCYTDVAFSYTSRSSDVPATVIGLAWQSSGASRWRGGSVILDCGFAPAVFDCRGAAARLRRVACNRVGSERAVLHDVEREAPVRVDALALSAQGTRGARFDLDLLAGGEAGAEGDEAVAVERDQLERDGAGAVACGDGVRNHAGERSRVLVLGGDGDPPGGAARVGPEIELDVVAQRRDHFGEIAAEALGPHAEGVTFGQALHPETILHRVPACAARAFDQFEAYARGGAARVERAAAMPCIGSPGPGERKRGERDSPGHRYWSCTIDATEGTPFVFRMKSM